MGESTTFAKNTIGGFFGPKDGCVAGVYGGPLGG